MTFSEFGRRPEENGDHGTDHGTAAPHFVIGSNVRGGLYGGQPSLTHLDNNGNLIPAVDFHQMYASVLDTWMGANATNLLGKAYTPLNVFLEGPSAPGSAGPSVASEGYWVAGPSGHVHGMGIATKFGSLASVAHPIVAGASTGTTRGLWLCGSDGGVFSFGDAKGYGSPVTLHHAKPFVGMAATPSGKGYWLCAADGAVFAYGDAKNHGQATNIRLAKPIVAMAATPTGNGYWLCASDGGIFAYGDAKFHGSTGNIHLVKPIVTLASTPSGNGYWFCASDGGIFAVRRRQVSRHGAPGRGRVRHGPDPYGEGLLDRGARRHRLRVRRCGRARQRARSDLGHRRLVVRFAYSPRNELIDSSPGRATSHTLATWRANHASLAWMQRCEVGETCRQRQMSHTCYGGRGSAVPRRRSPRLPPSPGRRRSTSCSTSRTRRPTRHPRS